MAFWFQCHREFWQSPSISRLSFAGFPMLLEWLCFYRQKIDPHHVFLWIPTLPSSSVVRFLCPFFPGSNFSPAVFGFRSWLRNQWLVVQYSWPSTAPGNWSRFGWPLLQRARNPFGRSRPSCSLWFAPINCCAFGRRFLGPNTDVLIALSKGVTFGQLTKGLTWFSGMSRQRKRWGVLQITNGFWTRDLQ